MDRPTLQPQTGNVGAGSQPDAARTDMGSRSDAFLCACTTTIVSEGGCMQGLNIRHNMLQVGTLFLDPSGLQLFNLMPLSTLKSQKHVEPAEIQQHNWF